MRRFKKAGIGLLLCLCICLCAGAVIFAVRRRNSGEMEYSETEFRSSWTKMLFSMSRISEMHTVYRMM